MFLLCESLTDTNTSVCVLQVQLWTLTLGHSVVFSGLFSNAWSLFSRSHRRQQVPAPATAASL